MVVPASIPGILDVELVRGAASSGDALDLVIEVPHGATRTEDFDRVAARLASRLPDRLVDFFHVNTDSGAPELAAAIARHVAAREPARTVAVLCCRIPRTFIDTNRQLDASPEDFKAGKVSPGLMPWITEPADRELLRDAHARYVGAVHQATGALAASGAVLLLHSYAPRTVDVEVDARIVESLHRAYQPDVEPTWPLRPELDVIGKATDGTDLTPAAVVEALRAGLTGLTVGASATYPLHPSTQAWDHVQARPGRALCLEVRRDLLADPFIPFAQQRISSEKVERLAAPIATALCRWW